MPPACGDSGFGFRVSGFVVLVLRVSVSEFRVSGSDFQVPGPGFRVSGFGSRTAGTAWMPPACGVRVSRLGFCCFSAVYFVSRISVSGFRVSGSGCWVPGFGFPERCGCHLLAGFWYEDSLFFRVAHGVVCFGISLFSCLGFRCFRVGLAFGVS